MDNNFKMAGTHIWPKQRYVLIKTEPSQLSLASGFLNNPHGDGGVKPAIHVVTLLILYVWLYIFKLVQSEKLFVRCTVVVLLLFNFCLISLTLDDEHDFISWEKGGGGVNRTAQRSHHF